MSDTLEAPACRPPRAAASPASASASAFWRLAGLWLAVGASVAGCVSSPPTRESRLPGGAPVPTTTSQPPSPSPAPSSSGSRDLVTASDESEAARRGRLRLELATRYFAQGQATTALDEVKQSLAADPNQSAAYNLRGLIYTNLNQPALAEESYRRALQINPNDGDAKHNYGWFLCLQKRYPEAHSQFDAAVALPQYRERGKTLMMQGVCHARAGQLPESEKLLQRAFELDPGNPTVAMNLADVLYRRGDYERARFYVKRVNDVRELSNAESLWLGVRVERKLNNRLGVNNYGDQLRIRFPNSREVVRLEKGQFDD